MIEHDTERKDEQPPAKSATSAEGLGMHFGVMANPAFVIPERAGPMAAPAGMVPAIEQKVDETVRFSTMLNDDSMFLAARFRQLCSEPGQSIMLTGLGPNHGSSEITAQIALAMTSMNLVNRLLVIDANLAAPIHKCFGVPMAPGLMDLLAEESSVFNHVRRLPGGLSVLSVGAGDEDAAGQLLARRGRELFEKLVHCHTLTLVNGPSFGSARDTLLASHVDMVALVAPHGKVSVDEVQHAKNTIESVGSKLAGIILSHGD